MLQEIKTSSGQTMYDLALMTYGTLDRIVKLCDDNGIDNVNYAPTTNQTLFFDDELVVNQQISGVVMSTKATEGFIENLFPDYSSDYSDDYA